MRSTILIAIAVCLAAAAAADSFEGRFYAGEGDVEYIKLLDIAARMFYPDPEFQNISMLYSPDWNGFVEGPTWGAWWIQNSYGPSYCAMPFLTDPYVTWLQNAQDLWFSQMGDGKRVGEKEWVAPDGCLCDAASPGWIFYKQGDGKTGIHDWGMEFTAAGIVLQAELLLIGGDVDAIKRYLPMLERSADFIWSRRDPENNLFLAGPAGNLLAPSYAGWKKPDGTHGKAYLTGLSITYIAALDRLVELAKYVDMEKSREYARRRDLARKGLDKLVTDEGYFIKSLDPDGARHGVYGAEKHGYFEAVCNHDAIAFRVVDDEQAERIYDKIASIPGLRPHNLIITNYPGLDDMYEPPTSWLWKFGTWVNGGHWTTCEARMMLAYSRLGKYDDARKSFEQILKFARIFRMDNPMTEFGNQVYQPKQPINCVYDNWGAPAALIRGLFEYVYTRDNLRLIPHIPPGIRALEQKFPVRFGDRRIYISAAGSGPVTAVTINGEPWHDFTAGDITLPRGKTPREARIAIGMGGQEPPPPPTPMPDPKGRRLKLVQKPQFWNAGDFADGHEPPKADLPRVGRFYAIMCGKKLGETPEACQAGLVIDYFEAIHERIAMKKQGKLPELPPESQKAADASYLDAAARIAQGLQRILESDKADPQSAAAWKNAAAP